MPIEVNCPQCGTRFAVHERFGGREGPCPKCKAKIMVPKASEGSSPSGGAGTGTPKSGAGTGTPKSPAAAKTPAGAPAAGKAPTAGKAPAATAAPGKPPSPAAAGAGKAAPGGLKAAAPAASKGAPARPAAPEGEIKIHGPEEFAGGGKDKKGRPIGKPISRKDPTFNWKSWVAALGAIVIVLIVTYVTGQSLKGSPLLPWVVGGLIFLTAVPLAYLGYWILSDPEFEGYEGTELWGRIAVCAAIYTLMWGARAMIPPDWTVDGWNWILLAVPFLIVGMGTAYALLDMENENAGFHFALFLGASVLLRGIAGMPWV